MWQAAACVGKEIGDEGPGIDTAASAGFQHAHGGGVGRRALLGAGAVGDPAGDDGVPEGALGVVVGCALERCTRSPGAIPGRQTLAPAGSTWSGPGGDKWSEALREKALKRVSGPRGPQRE